MSLYELKLVNITVTNPDGSTHEETYEPFNSRQRPMYWALIQYTGEAGLHFRHPDIAKSKAYNEMAQEFRDNIYFIQIASLNGYDRALLKPKKK